MERTRRLTAQAGSARYSKQVAYWRVSNDHDPFAESIDPSVSCSDCEAVCCRLTVVIMPEDRVPAWLVDHDSHGLPTLAKGDDGWCAAVDPLTSRCSIYEDRPAICRKFAMGSPSCRDERSKWFGPSTIGTRVVVHR